VRWAALLALLWVFAQAMWLHTDGALRDGDAMGHVGTVEELLGITYGEGWAAMAWRAAGESWGEYPPLYPASITVAARLTGLTDLDGDGPEFLSLGWGALLILAGAAVGTGLRPGWAAESDDLGKGTAPRPSPAPWIALVLTCSPLLSGVGRMALPETAALALSTVALAALAHGLPVFAGLALGLAFWTKQTTLFLAAPLALLAWRRGPASPFLRVAAGVAAPWYLTRWGGVQDYLAGSAAPNPDQSPWVHQLLYYPLVILQELGSPWAWLILLPLAAARGRALRGPWLPLTALTLVLLALVPKKYARLTLWLLPPVAVVCGVVLTRASRHAQALAASVLGLGWASSQGLLPLRLPTVGLDGLDERCAQPAVRPPTQPEFPREELLTAMKALGERTVGAAPWPASPCGWQTTHDLGEHLAQWWRRGGLPQRRAEEGEVPGAVLSEGPFDCTRQPSWCEGRGAPVELARVPYDHPLWTVDLRVSSW
jgi:hypothetical protein